jgi:uncharacterized protein YunC (DUF1805 family)
MDKVGTGPSALEIAKNLAAELGDAIHRATVAVECLGVTTLDDFQTARANLENRVHSVERHAEALGMAIYEIEEAQSSSREAAENQPR